MNKYLYNKIEQANSAYFENLIFIANEVCRERPSDAFEEFTDLEPSKIAKVLGWNNKESTYKLIEDHIKEKEFASLLLQHDKTGFIAECHLPEHSNFMFNEGDDSPWGSTVHLGVCRIVYVYAESIGELVEKLEEEADAYYVECYEAERSEKRKK